ncbi:hypothetical protein E2C01_018457 [Portunus trituberculatus]|uniref:Uncharacterized protein n=1 Tax=Portunus trituberculatus TaxID=210409 RepID=A0A5B7DV70_PORTR|nr:hypothetical protein [Portunus trituberculatus]
MDWVSVLPTTSLSKQGVRIQPVCAPPLQEEKQLVIRGIQSCFATSHYQILDASFVFSITHQCGKNTGCPLHQSTVRSECSLCHQYLSLCSVTQGQCLVSAASLQQVHNYSLNLFHKYTYHSLLNIAPISPVQTSAVFLQETYEEN